jgi:hypothetical protein
MPDGTNGGRAEIRSILGMAAMRRAPEGIHCAAGCAASSAMSRLTDHARTPATQFMRLFHAPSVLTQSIGLV